MLLTGHHDDERRVRVEEERRLRLEQRLGELRRLHDTAMKRLAETERTIAKTGATIRQLEDELKRAKTASGELSFPSDAESIPRRAPA